MEIYLNSKLQVVTNLNLHYRVNRNLTRTKISNIYTRHVTSRGEQKYVMETKKL